MTILRSTSTADTSLMRDLLGAARYYLRGRRGWLALAAIALGAGLASNWTWLVAAGAAPLLISVLPCVAVCTLGLCMSRMGGRSCSTETTAEKAHGRSDGEKAPVGDAAIVRKND